MSEWPWSSDTDPKVDYPANVSEVSENSEKAKLADNIESALDDSKTWTRNVLDKFLF